MSKAVPPDASGYTIFCEDIRAEASGQFSLVGVFQGDIGVAEFPAVIPKFGLLISYRQALKAERLPVQIKVTMVTGDEEHSLMDTVMDLSAAPKAPKDAGDNGQLSAMATVVFTPLSVPAASKIKVRAYRDDLELKLGTVRIGENAPAVVKTVSGSPT